MKIRKRRPVAVAIAIALALLMVSAMPAAAANTAIASEHSTSSDFETGTLSEFETQGDDLVYTTSSGELFESFENSDWDTDWDGTNSGSTNEYTRTSTYSYDGGYSLRFDGSSEQGVIERSMTQDTYDGVSWAWRLDSHPSSSPAPQVRLADGSFNNGFILVGVGSSGDIVYYDGSTWAETGVSVPTGQWFEVHVANIDYTNDQFDIEVYDESGGTIGTYTNADFRYSADHINYIYQFHGEDNSPSYIDDIRTYDDTVGNSDPGSYTSATHEVDDPTDGFVDVGVADNVEYTITWQSNDGTGWSDVTSSTYTTAGTKTADLSTATASDYRVVIDADAADDSGDGELRISREGIEFENSDPTISNKQPADGNYTEYAEVTLSADIDDDDLETAQGDAVAVEFFVDGAVVHTETVTTAQTVEYTDTYADGTYEWQIEATDEYGGSATTVTRSFTVEHNPPVLDDTTASPTGGETTRYASNTLEIDVSDDDFTQDGDTVTVDFYIDNTHVGSDTLESAGTATYTTGELADGTYDWHAEATDSYGYTDTSGTHTYTIDHYEPQIDDTSASPQGGETLKHGLPELSAYVSDEDFTVDGDELTAEFYVNGGLRNTQTVTEDGTISYELTDPLDDGEYTWTLEVTDDYGQTTSGSWTFNVDHPPPEFDNAAASPQGNEAVETRDITFEIPVSDPEFTDDPNEQVTVEWFLDGSKIGEKTYGENTTASLTETVKTGGDHTWYAIATDAYGSETTSDTFAFQNPGELYIRDVLNPDTLVNDATVTVTFIQQDSDSPAIDERTTTDGTVDMAGLPITEPFVVEVRSDGYTDRNVLLSGLTDQDSVYLLNDTESTVETRFTINDQTGTFGPESTLILERPIERDGVTEHRRVYSDRFGVEGVTAVLQQDKRYRLSVQTTDGTVQGVGPYRASVSEQIEVQPGAPSIEIPDYEESWGANADIVTNDEGNKTLQVVYEDPKELTDSVRVHVYERGNESNQLAANQTYYNLGYMSASYPLDENQSDAEWVVDLHVDRDGEEFVYQANGYGHADLVPTELSETWRLIIGVGILFLSAGLFSALNVGVGMAVVSIEGAVLYYLGWLGGATTGIAVAICLFFSALYYIMKSRGGAY